MTDRGILTRRSRHLVKQLEGAVDVVAYAGEEADGRERQRLEEARAELLEFIDGIIEETP